MFIELINQLSDSYGAPPCNDISNWTLDVLRCFDLGGAAWTRRTSLNVFLCSLEQEGALWSSPNLTSTSELAHGMTYIYHIHCDPETLVGYPHDDCLKHDAPGTRQDERQS